MTRTAKAAIVVLLTLIAYVSINSIVRATNPRAFVWYEEDKDERSWIASSRSWFDRKACRWLGICGAAHIQTVHGPFGRRNPAEWTGPGDSDDNSDDNSDDDDNSTDPTKPWQSYWFSSGSNHSDWDADERERREIPDYVFDYAPLVHLYSKEQFWPGDIAEHLYHTTPHLNYDPIQSESQHPSLSDLDQLNQYQWGRPVFLASNDDPLSRPPWLEGEQNIPEIDEKLVQEEAWADWDGRVDGQIPGESAKDRSIWDDLRHLGEKGNEQWFSWGSRANRILHLELRKRFGGHPIQESLQKAPNDSPPGTDSPGGRSDAPAILVVMDKGNGVVDAFWFFFYSFNLGNTVANVRFGNHVGDWEHCLMRFHNGKPKAMFFSAHNGGEAYRYEAIEKIGQRPVIYSAEGSHAMYATAGVHEYILPWGLLHDVTDRGPLWDPLQNKQAYTYANNTLRASTVNPKSPTEWFFFRGHWGDKFYPLGDRRQYRFAGQYHFVNGPLGPRFKNLNRRKLCQGPDRAVCVIKDWIGDDVRTPRWTSSGTGE
ncbi:Vacuolar protein sorting-associated protein 62 [Penicillium waksmanii]|uniref:Vacuolar protein sorting-associated protein 62 n=1 Tax=Penicillium waksmanii TaxID=69791 RepID=UPI00254844B3|nr:Vacuolar protein sorting-associated protein 62 [Penicillium waksmanii]KAJ5988192.1 Vacuolar protein sorting-associated protein 62 [Penicillium waksmanii]